jgi:hypothetical protein
MVGQALLFLALAGLLTSGIYLVLAVLAAMRFRFALLIRPRSCPSMIAWLTFAVNPKSSALAINHFISVRGPRRTPVEPPPPRRE